MRRTKIFACLLAVGLASCGGGGGGGSSTPADPTSSFPAQTALTYSGSTASAAVTSSNAGVLASNVLGASASGTANGIATGVQAQVTSSAEAQPTGVAGLGRRLAKAIRSGDLGRANTGALTGARIDQTTPCDSGSIRIFGDVSDSNGTGTVTVHYLACRTGSDTVNGPAQLQIASNSGGVMTDGTLSFTRINFTGPGVNSDMTGTIRSQVSSSSSSATETLTQNTTMLDNATGRMTQAQNVRITNVYDDVDSPSFFTQNITGTVCDSAAGCVAITTNTIPTTAPWGPFYFSTIGQSFPDWGQMTLTGATSSRVRVTSLGTTVAKLEVDADGDGTFENTARMRWVDFDTAIGADLGDNDADGMHNSWETQKGLNPNNNDAGNDSDGDGWTNLTEYQRGSEPNTPGSVPGTVRSVWVTGVSDLNVDAGGQVQVFTSGSSGVLLDPVTAEVGAAFSGGTPSGNGTTATDAQGRTFTLTGTADPKVWTLASSTGTSITITNIAGTSPSGLIRYGTRGLAFRTTGASGPGYIYLIESMQLIP
jgi:hypothetical protein